MPGPTFLSRIQHTIGRAFRETGQALDRVGIRGSAHAQTKRIEGDDAYIFCDHLSRHRNLMPLLNRGDPVVHDEAAFIAPCSSLIGTVHIGTGSSVWYGAILRADTCNMACGRNQQDFEGWRAMTKKERTEKDRDHSDSDAGGGIFVGKGTNIQDGCIVTSTENHTVIGDGVTVGHCAAINSAVVEDNCLIGMGAILNPGSKVETLGFVAAGSVIERDVVVKSGELWVGNPARKLRDITEKEKKQLFFQADEYVKKAVGQSHAMELGGNITTALIETYSTGVSKTVQPSLDNTGK